MALVHVDTRVKHKSTCVSVRLRYDTNVNPCVTVTASTFVNKLFSWPYH